MQYLRERGVKGFVAMNILVFDEELRDIEERARAMAEAGVDAVIVQVWLCAENLPPICKVRETHVWGGSSFEVGPYADVVPLVHRIWGWLRYSAEWHQTSQSTDPLR